MSGRQERTREAGWVRIIPGDDLRGQSTTDLKWTWEENHHRLADLGEIHKRDGGLPEKEQDESYMLEQQQCSIMGELRRREQNDKQAVQTADAFHEETPDFLRVLESGNAVVLAKYLHDRSTFELDLLAANGATVAELAGRISRYRKHSGPSDPHDVVVLDPEVPEDHR